jgi:tetratricopeptide (TPR) repeat protein
MTTSEHDLRQMMDEVDRLPSGPTRSAAFDTVMRHADAAGATRFAFWARMNAISDFHHGGDYTRAFMAFSWCVATFDRHPEIVGGSERSLLWKFKWIVWELPQFPAVPLDRTVAVLDDMERRFRQGNHSLHAVYQHRGLVAHHLGDLDAADHWYDRMVDAKRDDLSDCAACVPSSLVQHHVARGRYEDAVREGAPYTDGGCTEQPQWMLSELLSAYLHTGRTAEAVDAHRVAYPQMRNGRRHLAQIALHLQFCGLTGNAEHALPIVERHLPWLDRPVSPYAAMEFTSAAALVLRRLDEAGAGDRPVKVRGGDGAAGAPATVRSVLTDLTARTRTLSAQFDARNGNTYQSRRTEARMALEPVLDRLPLTALAGRPITTKRRDKRINRLVDTVAERTAAGDATGAALAQLDLAYLLRNENLFSDAAETAEEAVRALDRAGLAEGRLRAVHLLFQLYVRGHRHRDDAVTMATELLDAPALPAALPREKLVEEIADNLYGLDLTGHLRQAAETYRQRGDGAGEARLLRKAVRRVREPSEEWYATLARLDELADAGAVTPDEVVEVSLHAGRLLAAAGEPTAAWERAGRAVAVLAAAAVDEPDDHRLHRARLALRTGRPADAETLAAPLVVDGDDRWAAAVIVTKSLQARGRAKDAEAYMADHDLDPDDLTFDPYDY